ncbi:MAG: hypothetical protein U0Y10_20755 [Spirosomataceae bacterium]
MKKQTKSVLKLDHSKFTIDPSLAGKVDIALNSPDVIRMQEELRAMTRRAKNFSK